MDTIIPRRLFAWFAFTGLLRCGACGCAITAERKKGKYVYYRCTGHRRPCSTGYLREEALVEGFAEVAGRIEITSEQADWIGGALCERQADKECEHRRGLLLHQQQYQQVQNQLDRAMTTDSRA